MLVVTSPVVSLLSTSVGTEDCHLKWSELVQMRFIPPVCCPLTWLVWDCPAMPVLLPKEDTPLLATLTSRFYDYREDSGVGGPPYMWAGLSLLISCHCFPHYVPRWGSAKVLLGPLNPSVRSQTTSSEGLTMQEHMLVAWETPPSHVHWPSRLHCGRAVWLLSHLLRCLALCLESLDEWCPFWLKLAIFLAVTVKLDRGSQENAAGKIFGPAAQEVLEQTIQAWQTKQQFAGLRFLGVYLPQWTPCRAWAAFHICIPPTTNPQPTPLISWCLASHTESTWDFQDSTRLPPRQLRAQDDPGRAVACGELHAVPLALSSFLATPNGQACSCMVRQYIASVHARPDDFRINQSYGSRDPRVREGVSGRAKALTSHDVDGQRRTGPPSCTTTSWSLRPALADLRTSMVSPGWLAALAGKSQHPRQAICHRVGLPRHNVTILERGSEVVSSEGHEVPSMGSSPGAGGPPQSPIWALGASVAEVSYILRLRSIWPFPLLTLLESCTPCWSVTHFWGGICLAQESLCDWAQLFSLSCCPVFTSTSLLGWRGLTLLKRRQRTNHCCAQCGPWGSSLQPLHDFEEPTSSFSVMVVQGLHCLQTALVPLDCPQACKRLIPSGVMCHSKRKHGLPRRWMWPHAIHWLWSFCQSPLTLNTEGL